MFSLQYHQWLCSSSQGRTQDIPYEGSYATTQSQVSESVSPTGKVQETSIDTLFNDVLHDCANVLFLFYHREYNKFVQHCLQNLPCKTF